MCLSTTILIIAKSLFSCQCTVSGLPCHCIPLTPWIISQCSRRCNRQNAQRLQWLFVQNVKHCCYRWLTIVSGIRKLWDRQKRPFERLLCSTCVFMGKGIKRCTGLYRVISVDCITLFAVVSKFQKWDIDNFLSIQRNLQILEIKTTKCCYSPYFHLTQNLLLDTLHYSTI